MSIIKVSNLTKKYGDVTAVDHVSFEVKRGTMLGFLGINGAGKTTVIHMLATLLSSAEGSAEICGEVLGKNDQEIRRKLGIVYQQNCLDDILTVQENLICRGIIHGASKREAKEQCIRLCEQLKLGDFIKKKYRTLSGGQKRRCEIAAALMHTPEILFLDEPTTGLDPATRLDVWNTIQDLQKNEKMTVFLTTHYMEEASGAEQIIIMDRGKIVTSGKPFELKQKYVMDKLRLFCKSGEENENIVREKIVKFADLPCGEIKILGHEIIDIPIHSTLDALPILHLVRDRIEGFEVMQGNMDDVFLNAVGKELNGEGER